MQAPVQQRDLSMTQQWLIWLAAGCLISQTPSENALENIYRFIERVLIPLYTAGVIAFLSAMVLRTYVLPFLASRSILADVDEIAELELDDSVAEDEGVTDEQPVDMTGRYKLISVENFDSFLEVQGVPWALRKAACKARPIHKITHRGNRLTIRIEGGILTTQTSYTIGGPPVEVDIRGRKFEDRFIYLENGEGVRGIKRAVTENYDVIVDRVLSEDKSKITLTGRAEFRDERETIESVQIFQRVE